MTTTLTHPDRSAEDPVKAAARVRAQRSRDRKKAALDAAERRQADAAVDASIVGALLDPSSTPGLEPDVRHAILTSILRAAVRSLSSDGVVDAGPRIIERATRVRTAQIAAQEA